MTRRGKARLNQISTIRLQSTPLIKGIKLSQVKIANVVMVKKKDFSLSAVTGPVNNKAIRQLSKKRG
jgi:uncharacterized protein YfeS